jgi:hypothetical protein
MKRSNAAFAILSMVITLSVTAQETRLVVPPADGTPSPPAPPRVFPEFKVLSSKTQRVEGRNVTIQAVAKPDLPEPTKTTRTQRNEEELAEYRQSAEFQELLAERRAEAAENRMDLILLSATVYDRDHTFLRWWHEGEAYSGYSNIPFTYLGGFAEFKSGHQHYALIMGLGEVDTSKGFNESRPPYPDVLKGEIAPAYVLLSGDESQTEALAGIDALHRLYAAEKETLIAATAGRERARKVREAELKDNPPQKPDVTIQVWPKSGSRYLNEEEKEDQR